MSDTPETPAVPAKFDFAAFPEDTLFFDRREGQERRTPKPVTSGPPPERRAKKERRRRIDPTTFEKQYTPDEIEFMTAMQEFKVRSGRAFPTHREVLAVARSLGYRRLVAVEEAEEAVSIEDGATFVAISMAPAVAGG